jgi:hypothetical protein
MIFTVQLAVNLNVPAWEGYSFLQAIASVFDPRTYANTNENL